MNAPAPLEIPHEIDRRPIIWSYSLLHNFRDICPHQGEARYITKTIQFVESPEAKFGNFTHEAMAMRITAQKPLPLEINKWEQFAAPFDGKRAECEQWFYIDSNAKACHRFANNKVGHGKIDVAIIKDTTGYIGDFKTGNSKYEDPFELAVNAVLLKAKYPHLQKIIGQYIWLKEDRRSKPYDVSDVGGTWNEIQSIMATVTNYRKIAEFPKRPSGLCGWCQRYDCSENPKGQG